MTSAVRFRGEPPQVTAGDVVECLTAADEWVQRVATGAPRFDFDNAIGKHVYLTVPTVSTDEWSTGATEQAINWPAEDVRLAVAEEGP